MFGRDFVKMDPDLFLLKKTLKKVFRESKILVYLPPLSNEKRIVHPLKVP